MKERLTQSHTPDQGNRYRFVSLRSPCKGTHHRLDTLRSPIMETDQVLACWALAKRRCPPPFRQTLSLRGLCQAEPTWSFIADHEHSLLARLVALATPKIHHSLGSMRARADHGSASMIRFRKGFLHKLRSHHHFGELLSLGSLRLHRPTWLSIAAYHDVFSTASTHCACLRDGFLLVPRLTFKFLQQLINIHDRSCLPIAAAADIHYRFCSLRSLGRGCIPMVNARSFVCTTVVCLSPD